jgi:hypothetical protein
MGHIFFRRDREVRRGREAFFLGAGMPGGSQGRQSIFAAQMADLSISEPTAPNFKSSANFAIFATSVIKCYAIITTNPSDQTP